MREFDEIYAIAADRKGGPEALEERLSTPLPDDDLRGIPDDRWLSAMARAVFQAGFSWKVIDAKWPGFEAAFDGFNPAKVANYSDEDMDRLLGDTGIVRHGGKISSVIDNAVFFTDLARDHGSAAAFIADWPDSDFVGLLETLKKRGSRLGGKTGAGALRRMGRNSFLLYPDVVARLKAEGVIDKEPTAKRDLAAVQAAFNTWSDQSGRGLTQISQVLAMSV